MTFVFCPGSTSNGYKSFSSDDDGALNLRVSKEDAAKYPSVEDALADGIKMLRLHGLKPGKVSFIDSWDMFEADLLPVEE